MPTLTKKYLMVLRENSLLMAYNAGRKSYTFVCEEKNLQKFGEKSSCRAESHKPPPPPIKSQMSTFLEVKVKACFLGDILLAKKCKFRWPWHCF